MDSVNIIKIQDLSAKSSTEEINLPTGIDKPSTAGNIALQLIPVVGQIFSGKRGWGKDYWIISFNYSSKRYSTSTGSDIWFADIWTEDIKDGVELVVRSQNSSDCPFLIEINRLENGQSTRIPHAFGK